MAPTCGLVMRDVCSAWDFLHSHAVLVAPTSRSVISDLCGIFSALTRMARRLDKAPSAAPSTLSREKMRARGRIRRTVFFCGRGDGSASRASADEGSVAQGFAGEGTDQAYILLRARGRISVAGVCGRGIKSHRVLRARGRISRWH